MTSRDREGAGGKFPSPWRSRLVYFGNQSCKAVTVSSSVTSA